MNVNGVHKMLQHADIELMTIDDEIIHAEAHYEATYETDYSGNFGGWAVDVVSVIVDGKNDWPRLRLSERFRDQVETQCYKDCQIFIESRVYGYN